ncbi:MAG: FKBP-type peptidyl-prolyl cis-trans isomerase [Cyclobacteriaceae bacterium]|nr:FKBP-type peptidyl-prolyl cis-trans isomerase [Cyclobacteriaceae bacterium]
MKNTFLYVAILSAILFSCNKEETQFLSYEEQLVVDTKIIEDYLTENGLSAESTSEGLRYEITTPGDGNFPDTGSTVVVNYTGKLLNGSVFDSNTSGSFSFKLGVRQVIAGWDIGIALLSKGGKATLYIPSGLAYGTRGAGNSIGPNEVLIFDVELVDIR